MKSIALIVMMGLMVGLTNCSKDAVICTKNVDQTKLDAVPKSQLNNDIARISNYLVANSITATVDPSGLRYVINKVGTGATPCLASTILVTYSGSVLNANNTLSVPFDQGSNLTFSLSGLILGWQVAFPKFPAGTSATLFVPSGLGYGPAGSAPKIGSNAVLVFDVTLVSFQ
jgi:FKBP-type peptidyl-prolyl cis-trans isomerase FkpA